jgi:small conductance mechanosensitive channel
MMDRRGSATNLDMEKRAATIISVLGKLVSAAIWMVAAVMALTELTFNIQPLLAGLGVAGLALGLGAQSLIKDWLGGLFMLLEDQVRIGDGVSINGVSGAVEEINLRTTVLRLENGAVHIIPNGGITQLTNFTREYAYYVFESTLAHGADVDKALEILRESGAEVSSEAEFEKVILAPFEVMGVDRLTDKGPLIRARIKTMPGKQAMVGRELNRRFKEKVVAAGLPFPAG